VAAAGSSRSPVTGEPDEELVVRSRQGDDDALAELLRRYRSFARAKASTYFIMGGEAEDVVQEGMIGLYSAVRDFDPSRGSSFRAFADLCVTRQVLTAIKTATRLKHAMLNTSVSLDRPPDPDARERSVADTVAEPDSDPLDHVIENDSLRRLQQAVVEMLSDLEADVLRLYVEGRSYEEIADSLGRRTKSIDNALQRIKKKVELRLPTRSHA